ncbi:uncharacterized protein LOC106636515 [Copidosoma floridanum]|uniref:uncharacterized protein LOC106636515 n=1 Tax=Copidosoma floridanum TaxID=29053 RepID=UPI0006C98743|nr:uncharacterized protein LOC106636515 [Copidosoma floridanum]
MGCGQSKIGNLYSKNKKNKSNVKRNGFSIRSASIEQKNGNNKPSKTNNNGADVNRNEEQNGSLDKNQAKKKPVVPGGTPLLQQTEISNSQLDFFRMLDEKIENVSILPLESNAQKANKMNV